MRRRHEAVSRWFEWFDAGFDAGLTTSDPKAAPSTAPERDPSNTRIHTIAPHPQQPMHQCQSPSPVSITPAGSGPYVPTKVRR